MRRGHLITAGVRSMKIPQSVVLSLGISRRHRWPSKRTFLSLRSFREVEALEAAVDLLGPLRPMVGPKPADPKQDAKRKWKGHGFNLIWRPNFDRSEGSEFGQKEFFLQLNLTEEELDFTEITGTGIANRSLFEDTITLGGIAYTQAIKDSFDQSGQHFEPGVWANVPQTANPEEPPTIVRMESIPHGTTINLQGTATHLVATTPTFDPASITPFVINSPDDGKTGLIHQPFEEDFTRDSPSRTEKKRLPTLTPAHLDESEPLFVGRPCQANRS